MFPGLESLDGHDLTSTAGRHVDGSAQAYVYSRDMTYRYAFGRWSGDADMARTAVWVLLNPATGDTELRRRPTLDRCITWSRGAGFVGLVIVNLFAYRHTDPKALRVADDPIGPDNDDVLRLLTKAGACTVVAWGAHGRLRARSHRSGRCSIIDYQVYRALIGNREIITAIDDLADQLRAGAPGRDVRPDTELRECLTAAHRVLQRTGESLARELDGDVATEEDAQQEGIAGRGRAERLGKQALQASGRRSGRRVTASATVASARILSRTQWCRAAPCVDRERGGSPSPRRTRGGPRCWNDDSPRWWRWPRPCLRRSHSGRLRP